MCLPSSGKEIPITPSVQHGAPEEYSPRELLMGMDPALLRLTVVAHARGAH